MTYEMLLGLDLASTLILELISAAREDKEPMTKEEYDLLSPPVIERRKAAIEKLNAH
jgi:hypothetical protein